MTFIFISVVLFSFFGQSQIPDYMPSAGLVAWYPFNGNANDESGNGNNGIVNGASITEDRTGINNQAYNFNGRNNWIEIPFSNSIAIQSEITVSFWVYMQGGSCNPRILEINSLTNQCGGYSISTNGTGNTSRTFNGVLGKCTQEVGGTSLNALNCLSWHHVVFTASGLRGISQFYFDGVPQNIMTGSLSFFNSINYNNNNLTIGNTNSNRCNWFGGKLDDIAIYNRVLSKNEVNQLFTGSNVKLKIQNTNTAVCAGSLISLKANPLLLDIEGNEYPFVNINDQTWMQENLNVSRYRNGDIIPQVRDSLQWANLTTGAWCYYNNDPSTEQAYGKLYNWYAVNDSRGLAPFNWKIPAIIDINNLADTLGGNGIAGGKLKEDGLLHWNNQNVGASNSTDFRALPGGSRVNSLYRNKGSKAEFWNSDVSVNSASSFVLFDSSAIIEYASNVSKKSGLSVRCLKNDDAIEPTYRWSTGDTSQNIEVHPASTTTYYCTMTIGNKNFIDSVTISVFRPKLFTEDTVKICGNTFTLDAGNGYESYLWNNGIDHSSIIVSSTGWYSCTIGNGNCFSSDSIFVNIVNANILNNDTAICRGGSIQLTADENNSSVGLYSNTFQWSTGESVSAINIIPQQSSNYILTVSNGDLFCTDTIDIKVMEVIPDIPSAITIKAINSTTCGGRTFRYTAPNLPVSSANSQASAVGWLWSFTGNLNTNTVIDSGDINGRVIIVRYMSNAASSSLDSVRVCFTSPCGNGKNKSVKLSVNELKVPLAPSGISIVPVLTNVCSGKQYRYKAPSLPVYSASSNYAAVIGWEWSFIGTLGADAHIDSGDVNSQVILVSYNTNIGAVRGDSVKVRFTSDCGAGNYAAAILTNVLTKSPSAPANITITPITTNVCNSKIYRFAAPALVQASGTSLAATGWQWSFRGNLAGNPFADTTNAVIDSGNINSQIIRVRFKKNDAAITGDSIRVCFLSVCGASANKSLKLTNTVFKTPTSPSGIIITAISPNSCGAKLYRYSAPMLPVSSSSTAAATGYIWSFTGLLSGDPFSDTTFAVIDSGNVNSRTIVVRFKQNRAAVTGDSVRVLYTSDCGNSLYKSVKLTNVLLAAPSAPASITTTLVSDVCGARVYRYSVTNLPSNSTATGYEWSFKGSLFNNNGIITSGSLNSQVLEITYSSNAASTVNDSVKVRYISACGNSSYKAIKLTNVAKVCSQTTTSNVSNHFKTTEQEKTSNDYLKVNVYPNPSSNYFNVQINSSNDSKLDVKVFDVQARLIKTISLKSNEISSIGNELTPGVYIIEFTQGKTHQSKKIVKL